MSVDDVIGGDLAVGHLLSLGHEHVAFVRGPASLNQVAGRLTGARRAAVEAGLADDCIVAIETPALNVAEGRAAGARIAALPASVRPTAAFCANDLLVLGVLQEMTRQRIKVPGDLALVGYDGIDFAAAAAVPLTSIRQPRPQLGDAATQLLIDEVSSPDTHRHRQVVFEPELIIRDSTVPQTSA